MLSVLVEKRFFLFVVDVIVHLHPLFGKGAKQPLYRETGKNTFKGSSIIIYGLNTKNKGPRQLNHLANKTNDEFFKIFCWFQGYSHQNPKTYDEKILPALLSLEKEDKRFQENDEYRCMLYTELSYIF